jgi:hypothetical protein
MFSKYSFYFILLSVLPIGLFAQSGGNNTFEFLNLVGPARTASLGGNSIATYGDDVTLAIQNPSVLNPSMTKQLSISYVGYVADIKFGDVMYAQDIANVGTFSANLHFINYGDFDLTNENSEVLGTFKASEYALGLSWSKALDSNLRIGTTLKGILSDLGENSSNGVAADVALIYHKPEKFFTATILVKNIGRQLKKYDGGVQEDLPFEIQAGLSKKLDKAPFRFSIIGQQLQTWDITFKDPNNTGIDPLTGEVKDDRITFADKAIRHVILNLEVLFSQNFNLRFGYNFLRRSELKLAEKKGLSGLTAGLGFKISKFHFSYARSMFVPFAGSNHFTITTSLSDYVKK